VAGPLADRPGPASDRSRRIADLLAWLAVALAAAAAGAGLFVAGLYRDAAGWVQQAQGADLSTLALATPVFVLAVRTGRQGAVAGRLAALGVVLYLAYTYAVSAFSVCSAMPQG